MTRGVSARTATKHGLLDERELRRHLLSLGVKEKNAVELQHCLIRALLAHAETLDVCSSKEIWDAACTWKSSPAACSPRALRPAFDVLTSKVVLSQESSDGRTRKMVVELQRGDQVECVIMLHDGRTTLCVSSQVGCKMGCTFCATGTMGERGHLSSGEILEQLVHANRVLLRAHAQAQREQLQNVGAATKAAPPRQITNIVFMGMGEPLNNFESVKVAVLAMLNPKLFCLAATKVTVSTVGVIPNIYEMARIMPRVSLALSLHAPTQATRVEIVPAARAFSLTKLIAAVVHHICTSGKPVLFEYVLLSGINDSNENARCTGALLRRAQRSIEAQTAPSAAAAAKASASKRKTRSRELIKLNVIPYNPAYGIGGPILFDAPSPLRVAAFARIVRVEFGIRCTARVEMGQEIDGACGQLAIATGRNPTNSAKKGEAVVAVVGDVEDLFMGGVSKKKETAAAAKAGSSSSGSSSRAPGRGARVPQSRAAASSAKTAAAAAAAAAVAPANAKWREKCALLCCVFALLAIALHSTLGL